MTLEELEKMAHQESDQDAMHAGCVDYRCYCHDKVPILVAEIRRLREIVLLFAPSRVNG